jgi:hypothetical protein
MARPTSLRTAADRWYAALYLHEQADDALAAAGVTPPRWMDRLGLRLGERCEAAGL